MRRILRCAVYLQLLCMSLFFSTFDGHAAVVRYHVNEGIGLEETTARFFLLSNGIAREILEIATLDAFGLDSSQHRHIKTINRNTLLAFQFGEPINHIRPIKEHDENVDEKMKMEIERNNAFQVALIKTITQICDGCKNPTVIKWNGHLLLVGPHESNDDGQLTFKWISTSYAPFSQPESLYSLPSEKLYGIDARVVSDGPDTLFVSYSRCCGKELQASQMVVSLAEYRVKDDSSLELVIRKEISPDPAGYNPSAQQKNWAPFIYDGTIHFVQQINPLVVVSIEEYTNKEQDKKVLNNDMGPLHAKTVSIAPAVEIEGRRHEDMRSGSNAVLIDFGNVGWLNALTMEWEAVERGSFYLAFYHNVRLMPSGKETYFFGAYTFSSTAPFKLLAVSPHPLMNGSMYTGNHTDGLPTDYVNYPTSFHIEDTQPDDRDWVRTDTKIIHLFVGHQNRLGLDCHINLKDLLDSLMPV